MKCQQCQVELKNTKKFCSKKCLSNSLRVRIKKLCKNCGKTVEKRPNDVKENKTGNFFCNSSCNAKYQNSHKTTGTRRSKLERWIEQQLTILYPNLEIHYNRKNLINSELDIYIPSLKLAFELNGIFHYEPIYGDEKLKSILNNDNRKFQACLQNGIELCIVDTHNVKYLKTERDKTFLNIIINIIQTCLSQKNGRPGGI